MHITLDRQVARTLATRLQRALASDVSLPRAKAYEVLAQTLGYPNWDTLSALLSRSTVSPDEIAFKPATLYVQAFSCDEHGPGPDWVRVDLDEAFMRKVLGLNGQCEREDLNSVRVSGAPDYWAESTSMPLNIRDEDLCAGRQHWWFRGHPKHCSYAVESRIVPTRVLLEALRSRTATEGFAWAGDDVLVYASDGNPKGFIEELRDAEEF